MNRYRAVAWTVTLLSIVYAIFAGNVDGLPSWSIAIPFVVTGFWWAFGHEVLPDGAPAGRDGDRDRDLDPGHVGRDD